MSEELKRKADDQEIEATEPAGKVAKTAEGESASAGAETGVDVVESGANGAQDAKDVANGKDELATVTTIDPESGVIDKVTVEASVSADGTEVVESVTETIEVPAVKPSAEPVAAPKKGRAKYDDVPLDDEEDEDDEDDEGDEEDDDDDFDDIEDDLAELSDVEVEEGSRRRNRVDYKKVLEQIEKEEKEAAAASSSGAAAAAEDDDNDFAE